MAIHYCQFDKVMSADDASSLLSRSAVSDPASNISIAERLSENISIVERLSLGTEFS